MEPYLASVLGAVALLAAGVIIQLLRGLSKGLEDQGGKLVRIETLLTGATGDNGIVSDVREVKARTHAHASDLQLVFIKLGIDRRDGHDRRADA